MAKVLNDTEFFEEIKQGVTLVDFFAEWCAPCKMVAPIIDELAEEVQGAKVVKVNVDDSPELSIKYGIRSIPTFILFKDGEVVKKEFGGSPNKQFYEDLIKTAQ